MANSIKFKDTVYKVGDSLKISYRIKEGDKERQQIFKGVLICIKGQSPENKSITVRKITKSGIGVERIIPLISPYITSISMDKKSDYVKAKAYFVRSLSVQDMRRSLYPQKKRVIKKAKTEKK